MHWMDLFLFSLFRLAFLASVRKCLVLQVQYVTFKMSSVRCRAFY